MILCYNTTHISDFRVNSCNFCVNSYSLMSTRRFYTELTQYSHTQVWNKIITYKFFFFTNNMGFASKLM